MLVNPVHCSLLHPVPQDVRRLVVAMSRARLGLYIFGRFELFNNCYELQPTFKQLAARPLKLQLLPQERFGAVQRLVDARGTGMQTIGACGCGCRCCCTSCTGTLEELAQLVGELLGAWEQAHMQAVHYAQPVVEQVAVEDSDDDAVGEALPVDDQDEDGA